MRRKSSQAPRETNRLKSSEGIKNMEEKGRFDCNFTEMGSSYNWEALNARIKVPNTVTI